MPNEDYLMSEEEADKLEGSGSNPGPVSPSAPPARNAMPPYFQGSLPPTQQHDVSFVGTEVGTPRIPKTALMPLPLQSNPATNAAIQSTASKAGGSGGTAQTISLSVPNIFTPTFQTRTLPGPLSFTVAQEPEGTVWASPIPIVNGYADTLATFIGTSFDDIHVSVTSAGDSEVAIWFQASDGGSLAFTTPWTNWNNSPVASINAQFLPKQGTKVGYDGVSGGADYAGVLGLFGAKSLPNIVQKVTNTGTLTGPGSINSGNFGNSNTAGNSILVFVAVHDVLGPFDPEVVITDAQGNTYLPVVDGIQNLLGTTCIVYVCPVILASVTNSVTATFAVGGPATVTIVALELNAVLEKVSLFPKFLPLTGEFIPPINLALSNQNGGVTGVLPVGNGGTGLSVPGTSGNVLTSNGTAWISAPGGGGGFANPMTTLGDLITGGVAGAPGRLGIGSSAQVLTVVGGVPTWASASGGVTAAIKINGVGTATDKQIFINGVTDGAGTVWGVSINGTPDGG